MNDITRWPTLLNRVYLPYTSGDIVLAVLRHDTGLRLGYAMREGLAKRLKALREIVE